MRCEYTDNIRFKCMQITLNRIHWFCHHNFVHTLILVALCRCNIAHCVCECLLFLSLSFCFSCCVFVSCFFIYEVRKKKSVLLRTIFGPIKQTFVRIILDMLRFLGATSLSFNVYSISGKIPVRLKALTKLTKK